MKKTLFAAAALCFLTKLTAQTVNFTESKLPIVILNTNGQTIPDPYKITIDMQIIWNGDGKINKMTDAPNNYNGKIGIELRGSTSQDLSPKKPYSLELRDAKGSSKDVALLGMPKESDWDLIAPYSDKTLIRDALTYKLASLFPA